MVDVLDAGQEVLGRLQIGLSGTLPGTVKVQLGESLLPFFLNVTLALFGQTRYLFRVRTGADAFDIHLFPVLFLDNDNRRCTRPVRLRSQIHGAKIMIFRPASPK